MLIGENMLYCNAIRWGVMREGCGSLFLLLIVVHLPYFKYNIYERYQFLKL